MIQIQTSMLEIIIQILTIRATQNTISTIWHTKIICTPVIDTDLAIWLKTWFTWSFAVQVLMCMWEPCGTRKLILSQKKQTALFICKAPASLVMHQPSNGNIQLWKRLMIILRSLLFRPMRSFCLYEGVSNVDYATILLL